jgi:hypothetical protein
MLSTSLIFYRRPEDLPPEEWDLDPDDPEELCEELLLDPEPELNDLEEELPRETLIEPEERGELPETERMILLLPAPCEL